MSVGDKEEIEQKPPMTSEAGTRVLGFWKLNTKQKAFKSHTALIERLLCPVCGVERYRLGLLSYLRA